MTGGPENGKECADELYRVRHVMTGLYVARSCRRNRARGDLAESVSLYLDRQVNGLTVDRGLAGKIADVWIAVSGDSGVEIEPLNG